MYYLTIGKVNTTNNITDKMRLAYTSIESSMKALEHYAFWFDSPDYIIILNTEEKILIDSWLDNIF
jgi:hypothetical protein